MKHIDRLVAGTLLLLFMVFLGGIFTVLYIQFGLWVLAVIALMYTLGYIFEP